jgi:hypothetical protein
MKEPAVGRGFRLNPWWTRWMLAGLVLIGVTARATPGTGARAVVAHAGTITVFATDLHPGPSGTLTSDLHITTTALASDQLDAALAANDTAVAIYHHQVSVGEIPDLASCDGHLPSPTVIDHWLHDGPLLVPGRASAPGPPAEATLIVPAGGSLLGAEAVSVTLYFADAGQLRVELPLHQD